MSKKTESETLDSYRISEIEQIKALAHPLRMRIVETLAASGPMTTKQVAEHLGEKPTRLYHHVDQLEKVGLIRLTHTRQNRGATEKYYESIARQFRADSSLFTEDGSKPDSGALRPMIRTIFDNTTSELLRLVDAQDDEEILEEEGLLTYVEMHLDEEDIVAVQRKLQDVLEFAQGLDGSDEQADSDGARKFRLTLAYYPLDRFGGKSSD